MDKISITGGIPLYGQIYIGGAKNAALALMPTCLLTHERVTLSNLPKLADITTMSHLLRQHGVEIKIRDLPEVESNGGQTFDFSAATISNTTAPYDIVRKMRASILVLGPLLSRFGHAKVSLPGGCAIGTRPVDLHLKALEDMGAKVEVDGGYIQASVPRGRLKGAHIIFPQVTVGGTENILMAASLADGDTIIANAAQEPEVTDLANCLNSMGAKISGIGTTTLHIKGVDSLHATHYSVLPDRIETGTFAIAAAITRGRLELIGTTRHLLDSVEKTLKACGVHITESDKGLIVSADETTPLIGVDIMTEPYPGFPTDMQAQFMALMATAQGASMITETIFENRFMHVPELTRMGARINVHGASAIVRGTSKLSGAPVMATDLRASVSLILAGLAAEGNTDVHRVYHLDRGYEKIESKLAACGAKIKRISE